MMFRFFVFFIPGKKMTYFFRGEFRDDLVVARRLRGRHRRALARRRGLNRALSLQSTDLADLETLRTLN